jgi:Na+-driven multidrug efflux pump
VVLQALTLAVVTGLAATTVLLSGGDLLVRLMGATGELREPALDYLRIRALAGPAVLLIMAGHGIFRGFQDTRTPFRVTLGLNGVNLVLDPILIFGLGWGLAGAAWATVVAQWAGAAGFLWLISRAPPGPPGRGVPPPPSGGAPPLPPGGGGAPDPDPGPHRDPHPGRRGGHPGGDGPGGRTPGGRQQLWILLALVVDAVAVAAQALVGRFRGEGRADPSGA